MTTALEAKVQGFLARRRIAVAGVSRTESVHPAANLIYRTLKRDGHQVFAVNPNADLGHRCMRWLLGLTGGLPA